MGKGRSVRALSRVAMQTAQKMKKVSRELNELREGRASFYDLAVEIVEEHPLQAAVVLLAAWKDKPSAGVGFPP